MVRSVKTSILLCLISVGSIPVDANAEALSEDERDSAFACIYMANRGGPLIDWPPEPCKRFADAQFVMEKQPVKRALQIFIDNARSLDRSPSYLTEFMSIPEDQLPALAIDPYFMNGFQSALNHATHAQPPKPARLPDQAEFVRNFYLYTFLPASPTKLDGFYGPLATFAPWFILNGESDLAINVLGKLQAGVSNHYEEVTAYYSIFSAAPLIDAKNGKIFLAKMQEYFGELDWRPIYALSNSIIERDSRRSYYRSANAEITPPDKNIDLWPVIEAWMETDILSQAPIAGTQVLVAQATRYFQMKRYKRSLRIINYVLSSDIARSNSSNNVFLSKAYTLGANIIVAEKRYADLKPYLEEYIQKEAPTPRNL